HAIVTGTGERVVRIGLPSMALVLVPDPDGLLTRDVFRKADSLGPPRAELDCGDLEDFPRLDVPGIAGRLENDLQEAALSLRPELATTLDSARRTGRLGAPVTGWGPTVFGVFAVRADAERAAAVIPGA